MPVFKYYTTLDIVRGIKTFLKLEAGLTHDKVTSENSERLPAQTEKLKRAQQQIEHTRQQLENKNWQSAQSLRPKIVEHGSVEPENFIWILGTARVGSSWLRRMMKDLKKHKHWSEPMVGNLFGSFFHNLGLRWDEWSSPYKYEDFIFSSSYKQTWLKSIRSVVLDGATARFPKMTKREYLVVQEPNGSIGAPWLMEALPESRMIFLIRDPRDVVASVLDGFQKGGWIYEQNYLPEHSGYRLQEASDSPADRNPDALVEAQANRYLLDIGSVKQAYHFHTGPKVLVRYEDLRADTLSTMQCIYSALEIAVNEEELARVVDKHAWENIPEDRKGKGKVRRKATPGGWREDLTPGQVKIIERKTAPLLKEFYSGG